MTVGKLIEVVDPTMYANPWLSAAIASGETSQGPLEAGFVTPRYVEKTNPVPPGRSLEIKAVETPPPT